MSEEFDLRKIHNQQYCNDGPQIFLKLSFIELRGSILSGLHPFDNMAIIHEVKNRLKT